MSYTAYVLDDASRATLLAQLPPKFADVIAHHITINFGGRRDQQDMALVGVRQPVEVVGYAEGDGIEAAVVRVDGSTTRPDGKLFHITISLDRSKGRKPVDSNVLLKENGWTKIQPFTIIVIFDILH